MLRTFHATIRLAHSPTARRFDEGSFYPGEPDAGPSFTGGAGADSFEIVQEGAAAAGPALITDLNPAEDGLTVYAVVPPDSGSGADIEPTLTTVDTADGLLVSLNGAPVAVVAGITVADNLDIGIATVSR